MKENKTLVLEKMDKAHVENFAKVWKEAMDSSNPAVIVAEERPKAQFIGKVWEREIDYGSSLEYVMEVENDNGDRLGDLLEEQFKNKKVRVTIVELKPEFHETCLSCRFFKPSGQCTASNVPAKQDDLKCYKWRYFA